MKPKILFLYTEIAEYFLAGIRALTEKNTEVHIVKYPVNSEAPFKFQNTENILFYERNNYNKKSLLTLIKKINPQIIIVSGWKDPAYLKAAAVFKKVIPVILTFDNHWNGTIKQYFAVFASPLFLKTRFSYVWVPSNVQKKYARKLGYKEKNIFTGFYSADTSLFSRFYEQFKEQKSSKYPKNLLFVGRYIKEKSISLLWEAFSELQKEGFGINSKLICVGTGKLFEQRMQHPNIKHLGFIQPKDMGPIISETGIFVLPSKFEPWGVVIHEMAAAGYPLICSEKIGAGKTFLDNGKNGFFFRSENKEDLKRALKKIMSLPPERLFEMGNISQIKSQQLSPEKWADTVLKILNKK